MGLRVLKQPLSREPKASAFRSQTEVLDTEKRASKEEAERALLMAGAMGPSSEDFFGHPDSTFLAQS